MTAEIIHRSGDTTAATSERGNGFGAILASQLDELDEAVLVSIADSAAAQRDALSSSADQESRAMAAICGLIAIEAEAALVRRETGVAV
jgi:hypothetical protein